MLFRSLKKRKFEVVPLLFILLGVLAFIGSYRLPYFSAQDADATPEGSYSQKVRWVIPSPTIPAVLDPQKVLSSLDKIIALIPFSRLVQIDSYLQVQADLLQSWEFNPDSETFVLNLRPNLKFHDGTPLQARDVVFSIHEWVRPQNLDQDLLQCIHGVKSFQSGKTNYIEGVRLRDSLSVEVALDYGADSFIRILAGPRFVIFPANYGGKARADFLAQPVGSGPYRIVEKGKTQVLFAANPHYHLGAPHLAEILIDEMTEEEAALAFQTRRVDNLLFYPVWHPEPVFGEDVTATPIARRTNVLLFLSPVFPPFKSLETRKRVAKAIRADVIRETCYPGSQISPSIISAGILGAPVGQIIRKEEPLPLPGTEKANALRLPPFDLHIENLPIYKCLASAISQQLQPSGIRVVMSRFDEMFDLLKKRKLFGWIEAWEFKAEDPISNLQYLNAHSNEYLLVEPLPELQRLFESIKSEISLVERAQIYRKIDSFLVNNYYVIPLLNPQGYLVHRTTVHNVSFLKSTSFYSGWHEVYVAK